MDEDTPASSVWQSHLVLRAGVALSRQLAAQAEAVVAARDAEIAQKERERIIALIEGENFVGNPYAQVKTVEAWQVRDREYYVWVERERIIELINDKVEDVYGDGVYGPSDLIALIRGENE